ncbi:MAG: cysteine desulfurase [Lachnospiraceae bacterium]|nr:cysteine desulfurase [Lachnospiraceae bacterium]
MNKRIYLDNAATTRISDEVLETMMPYLKEEYGNPSSIYDLGADNKRALLTARKQIAGVLSCEPQNIYFTSGGTESDNWALIGIAESRASQGRHIITSKIEHHAVLNTCKYLEKRGYEITHLDVDEQGFVQPERLMRALRQDTILVSIMTANNEIGTIQPIGKIGCLLKEHPAVFHTDAVQAFGHIPLSPKQWGVDLLSASSHKFHGPKGCGFLYIRDGLKLPAFLHGGKQERGMRAGTENVAGIVGMGKAAELAGTRMKEHEPYQRSLRDYMIHRIESEIPYCRLNGPRRNRLANNVNVSFSYVEGETIVIMLDMEGICTSSASACSAGQSASSHVLREIGLPEDMAKGALRFTLNEETTKEDIDYTVEKLKEALEKSRKLNPQYTSFAKWNMRR